MAWPLMFSTAGMVHGTARLAPTPSEMASGMGDSMCAASYSPDMALSRISAQPAVLTTSTSSPCLP